LAGKEGQQVILVCEDDPMVAVFLQDVFRMAGHQVASARDGETAVRMANELQPSVMTLDIDLPGLDGGAVISRLKADPKTADIPIIILSAHPGWLTFMERHQAAAVLEKPCPPWELQAAVEQALSESDSGE
jgi:CheY-like chemotaxis protein